MIVIADTGPLNYLVLIGEVDVLPPLCTRVIMPEAVVKELNVVAGLGLRSKAGELQKKPSVSFTPVISGGSWPSVHSTSLSSAGWSRILAAEIGGLRSLRRAAEHLGHARLQDRYVGAFPHAVVAAG